MLKRLHAKKQNEETLPRKRKEQFTEKFRGCKRLNPPQPGAMLIRRAPESSLRAELYRRQRAGVFDRPIDKSLLGLLAVLQKDPELVRGQVFLRNERTGQRETIFETRTKAGKIISTDPHFTDPTYNIFCVVDWSPDGNYLLVQEVLGHVYSDVWGDSYWVYNRMRRQRDLIALKPLKQAIENYWQKRALDFREIRYQALAVGWEGRKSNRVVFMAFTFITRSRRSSLEYGA